MKRFFILLATLCIFINIPIYADDFAAENEQYIHIDGEELYNDTAESIVSGKFSLDPIELIQRGIDSLLSELRESRTEMINILVIALLSGVLQVLKSSGKDDSVSESALFACFVMITIAALKIFSSAAGYGVDVIHSVSDFITKLSPVLTVLLASGGSVTSAAAFHPILSGSVYVMTLLIDKCVVPLIYLSAVLGIAGHVTPQLKLSAFTRLLRSAGKWLLTAALTVFTGVTALYGLSAPSFDAVALKTMKFAVGSFVPVVGGILSETVETVLSGTQLMKNAVGVAGIVSLAAVTIVPVLKIFAVLLMLELCAAAAEPVTDKRICDMLKDVAASISLILGMVITISVLFIICIGIILGATN